MGKIIDITNQRFGQLIALELDKNPPVTKGHKAYWICQCDCGNVKSIRGQDLRQGKTLSCGCLNKQLLTNRNTKNLIGQKFGKLTPIKVVGQSKNKHNLWLCKCDCGKETIVDTSSLTSGNTTSCGCILSYGELIIAKILMEQGISFQQQYTFSDLCGDDNISKLRFDFAIFNQAGKLSGLIEFQGEQHFYPYKHDTEETFQRRLRYDIKKRDYCLENNIPLMEIPYLDRDKLSWEFLQNKPEVFDWS